MNALLIIGLILLILGLISYFVLFILQKKYTPEELSKKFFKKIPNASARIDTLSLILLAVIIAGLVMVLVVAFASH